MYESNAKEEDVKRGKPLVETEDAERTSWSGIVRRTGRQDSDRDNSESLELRRVA